MAVDLPNTMRALVLSDYREDVGEAIGGLAVREMPVPRPGRGEVLVRIAAAACNPSDLLLLAGRYGTLKKLPTVPGWEGAGEVVASGGGLFARWLVGKRVACGLQGDRHGTWAEYFIAKARECVPLKRGITFDQAAGLIINPFTAVGLLETAKRGGHRAAVHTAGASQVGRMLQVLAAEMKFPLIQVVRREEQVELLKSLGQGGKPSQRGGQTHFSPAASEKSGQTPTVLPHVLNSSRESFAEELREVCRRLGATVAFEAVAGAMTGTVLTLPPRSVVYVYGGLSEEPCENIDPIELIFHNKEVKGFYLGTWMRRGGAWGVFRAAGRVQRMINDGRIATVVQRRVSLDEAQEGLRQYVEKMTAGKVLIVPGGMTSGWV